MKFLIFRKLKRHIKSINFPGFLANYGNTGEYKALKWLQAYVEGRASAEPLQLVKGILRTSPGGIDDDKRLYILTILQWC